VKTQVDRRPLTDVETVTVFILSERCGAQATSRKDNLPLPAAEPQTKSSVEEGGF
jgi:hypothetical protein